jgi:hypothetical protein
MKLLFRFSTKPRFLVKCILMVILTLQAHVYSSASVLGDTIKPIPKINKEFLLVVHVVLDKDSIPNFAIAELQNLLPTVNTIYSPIGVSFKVCEVRFIYNFQYEDLKNGYAQEIDNTYRAGNRINVYVSSLVKKQVPNGRDVCGLGSLGAVSSGIGGGVYLGKGTCLTALVVAHELGHYFGLFHTFEGEGTELVSGNNCTTEGDLVCDTPADPYIDGDSFGNYVDNCHFISTRKDAEGNYYDPDLGNLMSYYPCSCLTLTRGQYIRMVETYLSNPILW